MIDMDYFEDTYKFTLVPFCIAHYETSAFVHKCPTDRFWNPVDLQYDSEQSILRIDPPQLCNEPKLDS